MSLLIAAAFIAAFMVSSSDVVLSIVRLPMIFFNLPLVVFEFTRASSLDTADGIFLLPGAACIKS